MTKQSLKTLIGTHFHKRSLEAWVIRTICNRVGYNPAELLSDIARHGCESGVVSELIYTTDCLRFYTRFESNIWDIIRTYLDDIGYTLGEFLDGFSSDIQDEITFKVQLVWFAVDRVAYQLEDRFAS